MARPSPRTQGVTEEGETFQLFGTQQLKFIDPAKPALGVKQIDVGKPFKGFTTSGYTGTKTTVFSERFQAGITGAVPVELHEEAVTRQKEKLEEMGLDWIKLPDLTTLFPPASPNGNGTGCECEACKNGTGECSDKNPKCNSWDLGCEWFGAIDKHGCECEDCKNGTGQCSDKNPKCNSWDIGCEVSEGITDVITNPVGSWWDKYGNYVYLILGVIGLGVLLWLLRPVFGFAKSVTEVSKSAVTKVNGLK